MNSRCQLCHRELDADSDCQDCLYASYDGDHQYSYEDYLQEQINDIKREFQEGAITAETAASALSSMDVDNLEVVEIISDIRQDQRDKQGV